MKKLISFAFSLVLLVTIFDATVFAQDQGIKTENTDRIYIVNSEHDKAFIPAAHVTNKEKFLESLRQNNNAALRPMCCFDFQKELSGRDETRHNGKLLLAHFDSVISFDQTSAEVSGFSRVAWFGDDPINADKITLTDKFSFRGLSISITTPGGVNWSTSGSTATWQESLNNNWLIEHDYSKIGVSGFELHFEQSTTGDFKFGSRFYTLTARDSTFL
ncbi:hypothetical protein [Thermobacillus xylanilyticus]|uniref:hypothetical protein n=1 Tax=Thermobacillus xylanilyticus TaxID=76633 RepID=UPI001BCBAE27|nr:hypothetical protein [Thermobacillus xylanilyticus]